MPVKRKAAVKKHVEDTDSLDSSSESKPKATAKLREPAESNLQAMPTSHQHNAQLSKLVMALQKELNQVHKSHELFNESFQKLESFSSESIADIDNNIKIKEEEIHDRYNKTLREFNEKEYQLDTNYKKKVYDLDHQYKMKADKMEHDFKQNEMEKALAIMKGCGKTVLDNEVHQKMTKEIHDLKDANESIEKNLRASLGAKHKSDLEAQIKTKDLEHKVLCADMKATIEQQKKEIATLSNTIETLKSEIKEQRNLTKSVAESTQKSVTQNFTK